MNAPLPRPYRVIQVGTDRAPPPTRVHHVPPVKEAPHLVRDVASASPEILTFRLQEMMRAVWSHPTALLALGGLLESLRRSVPEHQGRAITFAANAVRRRIREFEETKP